MNGMGDGLRARARRWISANAPSDVPEDPADRFEALRDWQRALYEARLVGTGWPEEYGGHGGTILDRLVVTQELASAGAPQPAGIIGLEVVGPVILEHGTLVQRQRFLPALLCGEHIWCQGFSEPDAGSDLASLRTRADPVDGGFSITGHKVWTSWAQFATHCALLARTAPIGERASNSLTYFLLSMADFDIDVRPIRQLTGGEEFCELSFEDLRVSAEHLLGREGEGWSMAMATLDYERGSAAIRVTGEMRSLMGKLVELVAHLAQETPDDLPPGMIHDLGWAETLLEVMEAHTHTIAERVRAGSGGFSSSVDKLFVTEVTQAVTALAYEVFGAYRTTLRGITGGRPTAQWIEEYLLGRASSIYGGSAQIQRNIVASRILGLPTR